MDYRAGGMKELQLNHTIFKPLNSLLQNTQLSLSYKRTCDWRSRSISIAWGRWRMLPLAHWSQWQWEEWLKRQLIFTKGWHLAWTRNGTIPTTTPSRDCTAMSHSPSSDQLSNVHYQGKLLFSNGPVYKSNWPVDNRVTNQWSPISFNMMVVFSSSCC